jgi:peptide/nickel transport system substrate-binding protein
VKSKQISMTFFGVFLAVCLLFSSVILSAPRYGGTLTLGLSTNFHTLDAHRATSSPDLNNGSLHLEALLAPSKDQKIKPHLVESYEISKDATVFTIHLRKGVKFHNGRELEAKDIKWNFNRITDPKIKSKVRLRLNMAKVKVIDKYTLTFTTEKPTPAFLQALTQDLWSNCMLIMAPESKVNDKGVITHPIGTGPFILETDKIKQDIQVTWVKNQDYWIKGIPYLDKIVGKIIKDGETRLTALKSGDVDLTHTINVFNGVKLIKNPLPGFTIVSRPDLGFFPAVFYNSSKPPFNDKRVRQAIDLTFDKEAMNEVINLGAGGVYPTHFHRNSKWFVDVPTKKRNIAKAKALLTEAGYPNGIDITINTTRVEADQVPISEMLQAMAKPAGFRLTLNILTFPGLLSEWISGKYTMTTCGTAHYGDPDHFFSGYLGKGAPYGFAHGKGYKNKKVWELIEKGAVEPDFNKRKLIYGEVFKIIVDDPPWTIVYHRPWIAGYQNFVKNWDAASAALAISGSGLQYVWLDK